MSLPPADIEGQIADAYRRMVREARYRPAAPSDGLGNITMPLEELNLDAEAKRYAQHFWQEEEDTTYCIGCPGYGERPALVYAVEAARLLCAGLGGRSVARRLLEMALRELDG
jgi:hypothetical protein